MDLSPMAHHLINIQITQNEKEIFKASAPEDDKEKVEDLLSDAIGMRPDMDCSYDNIDEFILTVLNKTTDQTLQLYNQLQEEEKLQYFIFATSDGYEHLSEEQIEELERLRISEFEEETTAALKKMLNIEFNLVVNGAVLPLK
ncbi:hypothetical protein WKH56_07580 [Priestia sp. SB1]|uniref:hypothetical protein n=1 Tax=Priestia sp. SB1 TaxID=3132359 RepID=UPI00317142E9